MDFDAVSVTDADPSDSSIVSSLVFASIVPVPAINSLSELCNLCVSEESWFWGGADEGRLRVWDTKTRALITYRYIPGEMNPLASNHIHCLFVDSSGYLWIGTNAGLDQYDKRTGRFDHFTVQDCLSGNILR